MMSQWPIHINQTVGFILRAAGRERKTKRLIVQEEGKIEPNQNESFWNQTKASTALQKEKENESDRTLRLTKNLMIINLGSEEAITLARLKEFVWIWCKAI